MHRNLRFQYNSPKTHQCYQSPMCKFTINYTGITVVYFFFLLCFSLYILYTWNGWWNCVSLDLFQQSGDGKVIVIFISLMFHVLILPLFTKSMYYYTITTLTTLQLIFFPFVSFLFPHFTKLYLFYITPDL